MTDLPSGEWTPMLIGDQWPSSRSISAIAFAVVSRRSASSDFRRYSDLLLGINYRQLGQQEGNAAERGRALFELGATSSDQIARENSVKSIAYRAAHEHVVELRHSLADLAKEGNRRIEVVNESKIPLPEKVASILAIVTEVRARASLHSAACIGEVSHQIRSVLSADGVNKSPQTFAFEAGLAPEGGTTTDPVLLQADIATALERLNGKTVELPGSAPANQNSSPPPNASPNIAPTATAPAENQNAAPPTGSIPSHTTVASNSQPAAPTSNTPAIPTVAANNNSTAPVSTQASANPRAGRSADLAHAPSLSTPTASTLSSPAATAHESASMGAIQPTPVDPANSIGSPQTSTPFTNNDLAESLDTGIQTGAPVSASAEAIATAVVTPVHTAPPPPSTSLETIASAPPVFETAHAVSSQGHDLAHVGHVSADVAPPVIAPTPPAAVAPVIAPPVSAGPVAMPSPTPLIAYGADLRPPAVAAAAAPPVNVAAPGSAPINPSGSAAPTSQPTVVRQQPSAATPLAVAAGLTERAVAAATGGSAVGATAARTEAENRLQRLLAAVARQQPQLRWAIGNLDNGDTVLATDFAGGWLPPHVDIPVGVKLMQPAAHRRNLAALLGAATLTAHYERGQYLSPEAEPVAMSIRARDTTAVEDLGWALSQATKWRDGLPRLAHTLAKAITAQTGFLDSEVVLLREHLRAVERIVLVKYPANVNPAEVGNWQLLATIAALLDNDQRLANYHFAWFQTQAQTRGRHR
jgi:hypothetical protein